MLIELQLFFFVLKPLFQTGFQHTDYAIVSFSDEPKPDKSIFTFATSNALLGVEIMGKFQNMDIVFKRAFKIAKAINELMGKEPLNNCPILEDKDTESEVTHDFSNRFFLVSIDF
jgi:hypothetical protein